jgi:two-component SAPR family response regulator
VDDEQYALMGLQSAIEEVLPDDQLSCFNSPKKALEYAKGNIVDAAFLDVEMGGMNGLQLAKRLKDINGKTVIIFVTGFTEYAADAFSLHAGGYIIKPVTAESVAKLIEYLRNPVIMPPSPERKLRVQTFGNFEVFADGKPLPFARAKTKELLAYLVNRRGAHCTNNEITAVLWEEKNDTPALQSLFRNLVSDLSQTLNNAGIGDIIIKERGNLAIMPDKISCDLYDFCAGINVNSYLGEYMAQYSWAEFTNEYLDRLQLKTMN